MQDNIASTPTIRAHHRPAPRRELPVIGSWWRWWLAAPSRDDAWIR